MFHPFAKPLLVKRQAASHLNKECGGTSLLTYTKIIFLLWASLFVLNPAEAVTHLTHKKQSLLPQSIGDYWDGRLKGGKPLPVDGLGYQLIRLERQSHFGHTTLIDFIQSLGERMHRQNLGMLWVGDLSARQGGPLSRVHRSHQNGLDVDLFFYGEKALQAASVVGKGGQVNELWKSQHAEVIRLAALYPNVERIFVNSVIKKQLCSTYHSQPWLRKIRPATGHSSHIHVRLSCPKNSQQCNAQPESTDIGC